MIDLVAHATQWFLGFQAYAKANPLVAGAFSLWGLGVVTYLCRNVPAKIYGWLRGQLTTTLAFSNDSIGTNLQTYNSFLQWHQKNSWTRFSRSFSINSDYDEDRSVIGIGDGTHFFMYKGRLMWLTRSRSTNVGSNMVIYTITITMLGRKRVVLQQMIEEFAYKPPEHKVGIYLFQPSGEHWYRVADVPKRPLNTVVQKPELKAGITKIIDEFKNKPDWYLSRGLAYKMTILLHGLPGTGKTSLIKALASHYHMNLCVINIMSMADHNFATALQRAPNNALVVIEDFDSAKSTHTRRKKKKVAATNKKRAANSDDDEETQKDDPFERLSLTAILNALDGLVAIDNKIIFMTTNVLDHLDDAIVRKGRIDHIFEIEKLGHEEIREYATLMYGTPNLQIPTNVAPMLGCDLQAIYVEHKDSCSDFLKALPQK